MAIDRPERTISAHLAGQVTESTKTRPAGSCSRSDRREPHGKSLIRMQITRRRPIATGCFPAEVAARLDA